MSVGGSCDGVLPAGYRCGVSAGAFCELSGKRLFLCCAHAALLEVGMEVQALKLSSSGTHIYWMRRQ